MRAFLVTIHHIHNFGSVFQSVALYQYLLSQGVDVEVIDYRPTYYRSSSNKFKSIVGNVLNYKYYHTRKKKFDVFINENEKLTKKLFKKREDLDVFRASMDLFIAGGDQLWNSFYPGGRDDVYKLTFTDSKWKAAIGTSMGRDSFSEEELKKLAHKIKAFKLIGLRELSTVKLLKSYTDVPLYHFVDPVMLFDNTWYISRYINKERPFKEKYALVYLTPKSELLNAVVATLKSNGFKIVHICGFKKKCDYDYMLKDAGPDEILSMIYHADFVLSASFHATAFSVIFQKHFATLLPNKNTNTRINDLLTYCDLQDRIITKQNQLDQLFFDIDFSNSVDKINKLRAFNKNKIETFLNELEKDN